MGGARGVGGGRIGGARRGRIGRGRGAKGVRVVLREEEVEEHVRVITPKEDEKKGVVLLRESILRDAGYIHEVPEKR